MKVLTRYSIDARGTSNVFNDTIRSNVDLKFYGVARKFCERSE